MVKLELILFLITITSCLHLDTNITQPKYNADNYLSDLNARQDKFKSDVISIKAQIQQLKQTLNSSALTPNERLTALSEGIADQRDSLYNIQTYLYQPFEIEPCRQVNLTDQQRDALQQQINSVNQSLNSLESQVDFCPECLQIQQIKAQIRKQYNYLSVIQATVHSDCLPQAFQFQQQNASGLVNLANSLYKDNLKAENWQWGNTTQDQYRVQQFALTTQYNLTSCPIATPYVDSTQKRCVSCSGIYNLGERKCEACSSGQTFNASIGKCVGLTCQEGYKVDTELNRCVSICNQSQSYNFTTKKCSNNQVNCTAGYFYNTTTKLCQVIVCPPGQLYDSLTNSCLDANNNTVSLCPPSKPYWNSTSIRCQACPQSTPLYNKVFNRCQKCASTQIYNETLGSCQTVCQSGTYWNATSNSCVQDTVICPVNFVYNPVTKLCQKCPEGDSFYDPIKRICIKCPQGTHPDLINFSCHACPDKTSYNYQTKLCDLVACESGKYYSTSAKACVQIPVCTVGQYFSIPDEKCLNNPVCGNTQILNNSTHQCEPLPTCPSGEAYNKTTSSCQKVQFITSPSANNLIYAYPISEYEKQYNAAKAANPQLADCPSSSPYFDQNAKKCVSCSSQHPYFNLHTNLCQSCGSEGYDNENRKCKKSSVTLDPTLERLIMNII